MCNTSIDILYKYKYITVAMMICIDNVENYYYYSIDALKYFINLWKYNDCLFQRMNEWIENMFWRGISELKYT